MCSRLQSSLYNKNKGDFSISPSFLCLISNADRPREKPIKLLGYKSLLLHSHTSDFKLMAGHGLKRGFSVAYRTTLEAELLYWSRDSRFEEQIINSRREHIWSRKPCKTDLGKKLAFALEFGFISMIVSVTNEEKKKVERAILMAPNIHTSSF